MGASQSNHPSDDDPAPQTAKLSLVVKPDAARYWRSRGSQQLGMYALLLAATIGILATRDGLQSAYSFSAFLMTLLLVDSGTAWLRILRGRIEVTDTELIVRRIVGRRSVTQRSALSYAFYAPYYRFNANTSNHSPRAYVMDRADKRVIQLVGYLYPRSKIEAILNALSPLPVDVIGDAITPDVVDRRHPTIRSFVDRHSGVIGLIFAFTPAVAVFLVVRLLNR